MLLIKGQVTATFDTPSLNIMYRYSKQMQVARVVNDANDKALVSSDAGDKERKVVLDTDYVDEGELVLEAEPFAKVLRPDLWSTRCQSCFIAASTKLSRCSCKKVYYCM
jgi:hypothetical protein